MIIKKINIYIKQEIGVEMPTKNIVPRSNKEGQLGTNAKKWDKVIAHSGSFETVSGSITPQVDDAFDLGASGKEWKDLYIDGTANIDSLAMGTTITSIVDEDNMASDLSLIHI